MLYTTLKRLSAANACEAGMSTLKASLGKYPVTKRIPLSHILESNGLNHAIWAMQATTVDSKKQIVKLACEFALQSLGNFEKIYPNDNRPRLAIQAASDFMDGKITLAEVESAWSAARSAWSAAWSAAESARSAWSAAWSAAESARSAWSAAESARSAAESAESAAESAESAAESAWSAAWSAWSAAESAWSARSARSAAWSAAEQKQKETFLSIIGK